MSQTLITDFYKYVRDVTDKPKVYGYNKETDSWHCIICGEDMGKNNPRQLCGKYICHNN